jgi:hypothetical protein
LKAIAKEKEALFERLSSNLFVSCNEPLACLSHMSLDNEQAEAVKILLAVADAEEYATPSDNMYVYAT